MVDFRKLRTSKAQPPATDPIEIFRRLPKSPEITDLYTSQAEVLKSWYERRNEQDLVIKLHTGGGKTLVGLLIGQSILNEVHKPVIYLASTKQLVAQTVEKARSYNIPAIAYQAGRGEGFPSDFLNGASILISTYPALFNAQSRFGIRGGRKEIIHAAGIILDDAHVAFSNMRDIFTLRIDKSRDSDLYNELVHSFREDFNQLDKLGTFDEIVDDNSTFGNFGILEVPYWSWQSKSTEIRKFLQEKIGEKDDYLFVWPFLRDAFDYCHCLISRKSVVITPFFPLVDAIPTFSQCQKRIFMSATIKDDSTIIRTFNAKASSIQKPITSDALAGISERMILIPEITHLQHKEIFTTLQHTVAGMEEIKKAGVVILVSSKSNAQAWNHIASIASSSEEVNAFVKNLQDERSFGPYVFVNRYDGIDLPGNACRLLIMDGSPYGANEYEIHRASIDMNSASIKSEMMQKIEQGIGRGARGAGDYCVVILTGQDLVSQLELLTNQQALTSSTLAQLKMGLALSTDVKNEKDFIETVMSCLRRNPDWIAYHAETLASLTISTQTDITQLELAQNERNAFRLMQDSYFEKAINQLEKYCETNPTINPHDKGWLLQFAACIANRWGNHEKAQQLQRNAYANNRNLLRPQTPPPYVPISVPSPQAEAIVEEIARYSQRRAYMSAFEKIASQLVATATSNQFEQALADLGTVLGFRTQRPDKEHRIGPDVLWLLNDHLGMVMEAKSRKSANNPLTKEEHGQLLDAEQWFKQQYPNLDCIRISVHPSAFAHEVTAEATKVLTLDNLLKLVVEVRDLLNTLTNSLAASNDLIIQCSSLLIKSHLTPQNLIQKYLVPFKVKK